MADNEKVCKTCKFMSEIDSSLDNIDKFLCHRYPPKCNVVVESPGEFPVVGWDWWCGEWKSES